MRIICRVLATGTLFVAHPSFAAQSPVELTCSGSYTDQSSKIVETPIRNVLISVDKDTVIVRNARHLGNGPSGLTYDVELRTKGLVHFSLRTERSTHGTVRLSGGDAHIADILPGHEDIAVWADLTCRPMRPDRQAREGSRAKARG
jgi:hypothetical protein